MTCFGEAREVHTDAMLSRNNIVFVMVLLQNALEDVEVSAKKLQVKITNTVYFIYLFIPQ